MATENIADSKRTINQVIAARWEDLSKEAQERALNLGRARKATVEVESRTGFLRTSERQRDSRLMRTRHTGFMCARATISLLSMMGWATGSRRARKPRPIISMKARSRASANTDGYLSWMS